MRWSPFSNWHGIVSSQCRSSNSEADYGRRDTIFAIVRNYRIKRDFKSLISKPWNFLPSTNNSLSVLTLYWTLVYCSMTNFKLCSMLLVMSPSRAGSSHSSSWRIFSSARLVTFFHSAWNQKSAENEPKFWFRFFFNNYFSKIGLKMIKLCTIIYKL
jgi:hypothetical protein